MILNIKFILQDIAHVSTKKKTIVGAIVLSKVVIAMLDGSTNVDSETFSFRP